MEEIHSSTPGLMLNFYFNRKKSGNIPRSFVLDFNPRSKKKKIGMTSHPIE